MNYGNIGGLRFRANMNIQANGKDENDITNKFLRNLSSVTNGYRTNHLIDLGFPVQNSTQTTGQNLNVKAGGEIFFGNLNLSGGSNISISTINNNGKWRDLSVLGAYYLDSNLGKSNKDIQSDFYRYNSNPVADYSKNLPVPIVAKDQFVVSNGLSSDNFSIFYDNPFVVKDQIIKDESYRFSSEVQADLGTATNIGASIGVPTSVSTSSAQNKGLLNGLNFYPSPSIAGDQSLNKFFKLSSNMNELTEAREIENDEILRLPWVQFFQFDPSSTLFSNRLQDSNGPVNDDDLRQNRLPNAQVITEFTNNQCRLNGGFLPFFDVKVSNEINNYSFNNSVSRNFGADKFTGFVQRDNNGMRYIYSLPVLNKEKWDVQFGVDCSGSCSECEYFTNYEIDGEDIKEKNQYKNITRTFDYAENFLMTAIVGNDYIDVDPTDGLPNIKDRGYWMRFDYSTTTADEDYIWRAPFYGAFVNKGVNGFDNDDTANFSAGKREQYYLQRISTATHYAEFNYSERIDARGAESLFQNNKNFGAISLKLDKVQLFDNEYSKVLKTIEFTYDYSLCQGIPNNSNQTGKLTLKELSINNQESSFMPPYEFEYYGESATYEPFKIDRWGAQSLTYCNTDFSYVNQESSKIDHWHLKTITLPTQSSIDIEVSRDHYAYDEYLKPGQMMSIKGINHPEEFILDPNGSNKILFDKDPNIPIESYLEDLVTYDVGATSEYQVYFKVEIDLYGSKEIIDGYGHVKKFGEQDGYGYIEFEGVELNLIYTDVDPIVGVGWQKLKNEYRWLKYKLIPALDLTDQESLKASSFIEFAQDLMNYSGDIFEGFVGHYLSCDIENAATQITAKKSFIRLTNPTGLKKGGDLKVDRIIYKDNNDDLPYYGKVYEYFNGVVNTEPLAGQEENIKNHAVNVRKRQVFGIAYEDLFEEIPDLSAVNKSPSIVYETVKVKSLASDFMEKKFLGDPIDFSKYNYPNDIDKVSSTGYTLYEHYTAKEFPSIIRYTELEMLKGPHNFIPLILINFYFKYRIFSQGYFCENNDMHGKLKSVTSYSQSKSGKMSNDPISKTMNEYYHSDSQIFRGDKIYNCSRLSSKAEDQNKQYGRTIQNTLDVQHVQGFDQHSVVDVNTDITPVPIPISAISAWPYSSMTFTKIGISSALKSVHQKGLLKQVYQQDFATETVITFDERETYTSQGLVSISTDEFSEGVLNNTFSKTEPAYLVYDQLNSANVNYKYFDTFNKSEFNKNETCLGDYFFSAPNGLYQLGDVIYFSDDNNNHALAKIVNKTSTNFYIEFTDTEDFNQLNTNIIVKVIDSGYSGLINVPFKQYTGVNFYDQNGYENNFISAQVTKYAPSSSHYIDFSNCEIIFKPNTNISPVASYIFNGNRDYSESQNLMRSGLLSNYTEAGINGLDFGNLSLDWIKSNHIEHTNSEGIPVQSTSQDGIRSAILFNTKRLQTDYQSKRFVDYDQVSAKAINANHSEIVFEDFEETADESECLEHSHFDYKRENSKIIESYDIIEYNSGNFVLNIDVDDFHNIAPSEVHVLRGNSSENIQYEVEFKKWGIKTYPDFPSNSKVRLDINDCLTSQAELDFAKVLLVYDKEDSSSRAIPDSHMNEGHTGNKSLILNNDIFEISNPNFIKNKEYYISFWLKGATNNTLIQVSNGDQNYTAQAVTNEIEGWIKYDLTIPFQGSMTFIFTGNNLLFDDVRIQPNDAEMECYVYDEFNRVEYILDNNNFYSQYHYDNDGKLVAISKETAKGKRTISETRYHIAN